MSTESHLSMRGKKLLIFHQGALGDFVLTFPALIRLKKHFRQIDAICKPQLGELAREFKLIENWFSQDSARFAAFFTDAIDPDVINLLNAYDEMVLFSFSESLQHSINEIRRQPVFRIPPWPRNSDKIHVAVFLLKNLLKCGLLPEDEDLDISDLLSLYEHRQSIYPAPHSRKVLLHPGAGSKRKMWPLSHYIKLEGLLQKDNYKPEFVTGPAEEFLKNQLGANGDIQRVVHVTDDLSNLVVLMKSADGFIGNDSGVSHLAAFLGLPTVAVFGQSDPEIWGPVGPAVRILSPQKLGYGSKDRTASRFENNQSCFYNISPETAYAAFFDLMKQQPGQPPQH